MSGTEAGGHCGEVSTLVLIPEVLQALAPYGEIPILAAGGIATGRQMAAVMAMGAHGVWDWFRVAHHGGSGDRASREGEVSHR